MAIPILGLITSLFTSGTAAFKSYNEKKVKISEAKQELKLAKIHAERDRVSKAVEATTNWDIEAMRQSQFSWKDEALMIILFIPFVGSFIPVVQDYVKVGFDTVSDLPLWYQLSLVGIIAASFGLRWLFQGKVNKLSNLSLGGNQ